MSQQHYPQHQKPGKARMAAGWIIGLLCAAVISYIAWYFSWFDNDRYTNDAQVQQLLTPVNARVGGYIREVRFRDFQQVKKGDTLVIIDDTDYRVQEQLAQAALMDAMAGRSVSASNVNTVENNVAVSDSRIAEVKARLWNAEKNYSRYKALVQRESVTQQQFDQVQSDYEALKAQLLTLENSARGSRLTVHEANSRIAVNEAAITRAKAQLELARLNLSYTAIVAPCDGYVGRLTIVEGQLVQAGQQLSNVVDNGNKWIIANFKEKQLSAIKQGQRVRVKVDALPGTEISGTVQAFASATGSVYAMVPVDNATGNFVKIQQRIPVRIDFDSRTDRAVLNELKAGMNVVVYTE